MHGKKSQEEILGQIAAEEVRRAGVIKLSNDGDRNNSICITALGIERHVLLNLKAEKQRHKFSWGMLKLEFKRTCMKQISLLMIDQAVPRLRPQS